MKRHRPQLSITLKKNNSRYLADKSLLNNHAFCNLKKTATGYLHCADPPFTYIQLVKKYSIYGHFARSFRTASKHYMELTFNFQAVILSRCLVKTAQIYEASFPSLK